MKTYLICLPIIMGLNTFTKVSKIDSNNSFLNESCKISYRANEIDFKNKLFILRGKAEVKFNSTIVKADEIYLDNENLKLKAIKNISYKTNQSITMDTVPDTLIIDLPLCKAK